jgi:hypothetical protein
LSSLQDTDSDDNRFNHTPLRPHDQDASEAQYALIVTELVYSLLRSTSISGDFTFSSTPAIDKQLKEIRDMCGNKALSVPIDAIHALLCKLWHTTWPQHMDPTLQFLALHSLQVTGEFTSVQNVTGKFAKIMRAMRLVAVVSILNLEKEGETQESAYAGLVPYLHEMHPCTFHSIMSLQRYATSIVLGTMSMPRIWWVDRERHEQLLYKGNLITLQHWRDICAKLQDRALELWHAITFGTDLSIDFAELHLSDNLTNTSNGYNFIDDARNPFWKHQKALISLAFPPDGEKSPMTLDNVPGQLDGYEVRVWLQALAELEGVLVVCMQFMCGGPARATELASMLV